MAFLHARRWVRIGSVSRAARRSSLSGGRTEQMYPENAAKRVGKPQIFANQIDVTARAAHLITVVRRDVPRVRASVTSITGLTASICAASSGRPPLFGTPNAVGLDERRFGFGHTCEGWRPGTSAVSVGPHGSRRWVRSFPTAGCEPSAYPARKSSCDEALDDSTDFPGERER